MNALRRRPLLALLLAGFTLRAGTAILTERRPLFPAYYYTDARVMDAVGVEVAAAWARGERPALPGSLSQRVYGCWLGILYSRFGHRPLLPKLINALIATLALAALFALARAGCDENAALLAVAAACLWPSHIFFTSQNFKDAFVHLFCLTGIAAFVWSTHGSKRHREALWLTGGASLILLGMLRAHVLLAASLSLAAAFLAAALPRHAPRRELLIAALLALLCAPAYHVVMSRLASGPLRLSSPRLDDRAPLVPTDLDPADGKQVRPTSPEAIARFRRMHQQLDQKWAGREAHREISTQIFPEQRLESWGDVIVFLPQAAFYAVFMPLPGLYPLEGKLGRWLAALENAALLLLALAALVGTRRAGFAAERLVPLLFFVLMALGSGALELDLGGATRHKTLYLPLLFPFAFAALAPLSRSK